MGDGFSCHRTLVLVLVMRAVARLMYAQRPTGQGPRAGCHCSSDGRLAGSSLGRTHHCHKVKRSEVCSTVLSQYPHIISDESAGQEVKHLDK